MLDALERSNGNNNGRTIKGHCHNDLPESYNCVEVFLNIMCCNTTRPSIRALVRVCGDYHSTR